MEVVTKKTYEKVTKKSVKNRIVEAAWTLFHDKGYGHTTVDDIIELSQTSKGSFYYYFNAKDELLNTLSVVLDTYYEELEQQMDPKMNSIKKLLFLNEKAHFMMEEKIGIELITSLYSTQLVALGNRHLLDHNRKYYKLIYAIIEEGQMRGEIRKEKEVIDIVRYYSMCERALVTDWCLNQGTYSLGIYSRECMPIMMKAFEEEL